MPAEFPPISDHPLRIIPIAKIESDVIDLISDLSDQPREYITPPTELASLGLESLDFVEFIVEMERKWNLHFTDAEMSRIKTVGDAIKYVQTYS